MSTLFVAPQLVELLDRQFAFLLEHTGKRRIVFLPRLLALLARQPGIAEHFRDLQAEVNDALDAYRLADQKVRKGLLDLWNERGSALRVALESRKDDDHLWTFGLNFENCTTRLETPSEIAFPKRGPVTHKDDRGAAGLLQTFNHWAKCASESDFADFLGKVDQLRGEHEHSHRAFRMASETLAGLALQRLAYIAKRANPAPPGADDAVEVVAEYYAAQGFADLVHGGHVSLETYDTVDVANDRIAEDARVLHEDLRTRVIEGASRAAIVRRYAARCEAFDAERLRGLAAGNSKNAERSLTLDLAAYLFDQGFNPLIDATVAGLIQYRHRPRSFTWKPSSTTRTIHALTSHGESVRYGSRGVGYGNATLSPKPLCLCSVGLVPW